MENHRGKVAVITGASSGIGREAAKQLAARGWRIIGQGRDPERCDTALTEIRKSAAAGASVDMLRCDLSLLSQTARLAEEIARLTPHVDALLNNAGGIRSSMLVTPEGNEATFAGNHLGHFLLTDRLMPLLRKAAHSRAAGSVRIINVSSLGHEYCPGLDWSDLQHLANWNSSGSYCSAKLCNLLFTLELSRRVKSDGMVALAMHPGVVDSNFRSHATAEMQHRTRERPGDPPSTSAATLAWLAADPDVGSMNGLYFHNMAPVMPSALASDRAMASRLWIESEALIAKSLP